MKSNEKLKRLQVFLAHSGVASRRKSEKYIAEGRVSINGKTVIEQGIKVGPEDIVRFDGDIVRPETIFRYIALNKPPGYLSSSRDPQGRRLAIELIAPYFEERLYNIGRLDFMSEGLLLFTNDGDFAQRVGHPSSEIEKEYLVEVPSTIKKARVERSLERAKQGIEIEGVAYSIRSFKVVSAGEAEDMDRHKIYLTLIEGKNREIRRLFSFFDIRIDRLTRVRIGILKLNTIPKGGYRHLKKEELDWFLRSRNNDTSTRRSGGSR